MRKEPILLDLTDDYFCDDKYEAIRIFRKEVIDLRKVTLRQLKRLEEKDTIYVNTVVFYLRYLQIISSKELLEVQKITRAVSPSYAEWAYARLKKLIEVIDSRGKNENWSTE